MYGLGKQPLQLLRVVIRDRSDIQKTFCFLAAGKFEHSLFSIDIEREQGQPFWKELAENGAGQGIEQTTPGQTYLLHAVRETA